MNPVQKHFAEVARAIAQGSPPPAPPKQATRTPDPEVQAPAKAAPLVITKATLAPAIDIPEKFMKVATSSQAPADQPAGAKASTRKKGQAAATRTAPADQPTGAKAPPPKRGQAKGQESPEAKA
jgi:hypothetical protein